MSGRSDKLKKLEAELRDLQQWLNLGLVPKKDIPKHEAEIAQIERKIAEESERLRFLKESGDAEEYITPKRQPTRTQYTELPSLPDIDMNEEASSSRTETEADSLFDSASTDELTTQETRVEDTDEEDPFSDRNRWKRGMLHGDEDEW